MEAESSKEMVSPPKVTSTITLKKVNRHIQIEDDNTWIKLLDGTEIYIHKGFEDVAKITVWYMGKTEISLYGDADRKMYSKRFNGEKSKAFHLEKMK